LADGPTFDFSLTQEQIADATRLTAVHTNRTLQGLRRSGLIGLGARKLTIIDWDALTETGNFTERYLHIPSRAAYQSGFGGRRFSRVTVPAIR
jgi:hypothetical protein